MGAYSWESSEAAASASAASASEAGFFMAAPAEDPTFGKFAMHRIPSVDDLFAPMWRLDVRASGFEALAMPASKSRHADAPTSKHKENAAGKSDVVGLISSLDEAQADDSGAYGFLPGNGDEDEVEGFYGLNDRLNGGCWNETSSFTNDGIAGSVGLQSSSDGAGPTAGKLGRSSQSHSPSERPPPSASASDEDPLATIDEKKHKRMLSNRESARRSRLRKQQHLEDLRSQLLELRTQNSQILGKLTVATQQFTQINHDNQVLRLHAIELSRKLQGLHHKATEYYPSGLHAFGFGSSHLDPPGLALPTSTSSAYSLVSQALEKTLCDTLLSSP